MIKYNAEEYAPGIWMLGRHGSFEAASWVLESDGECAVMDMPLSDLKAPAPALQIRQFIDDRGWNCKYLLLSHPHIDHLGTIHEYRDLFPEAQFPVHYSVPMFMRIFAAISKEDKHPDARFNAKIWRAIQKGRGVLWFASFFSKILSEDINELPLGHEVIYMIYGPKHSLADIHHIYRGVWFPGDWWLGDGDPCIDVIAASKAETSIERIQNFLKSKKYLAHTVFPAHANNILRGVDTTEILSSTLKYHKELANTREELHYWKDFDIKMFYCWKFQNEFKET